VYLQILNYAIYISGRITQLFCLDLFPTISVRP
jgi:hypothetical protein